MGIGVDLGEELVRLDDVALTASLQSPCKIRNFPIENDIDWSAFGFTVPMLRYNVSG